MRACCSLLSSAPPLPLADKVVVATWMMTSAKPKIPPCRDSFSEGAIFCPQARNVQNNRFRGGITRSKSKQYASNKIRECHDILEAMRNNVGVLRRRRLRYVVEFAISSYAPCTCIRERFLFLRERSIRKRRQLACVFRTVCRSGTCLLQTLNVQSPPNRTAFVFTCMPKLALANNAVFSRATQHANS